MKPYTCPVCGGRGIVPAGFYTSVGYYSTTGNTTEHCRSCSGTGIIWGNSKQLEPVDCYSQKFIKED